MKLVTKVFCQGVIVTILVTRINNRSTAQIVSSQGSECSMQCTECNAHDICRLYGPGLIIFTSSHPHHSHQQRHRHHHIFPPPLHVPSYRCQSTPSCVHPVRSSCCHAPHCPIHIVVKVSLLTFARATSRYEPFYPIMLIGNKMHQAASPCSGNLSISMTIPRKSKEQPPFSTPVLQSS